MTFQITADPSCDLINKMKWGQHATNPGHVGIWTLLEPAGTQNHAPQLCWANEETLVCVWMAGGQEGTSGMSIFGASLKKGRTRWSGPKLISQNADSSEQNPLLFKGGDGRLHLIHTAQTARDPSDISWQETGLPFSMQWTAKLHHQSTSRWGSRWTKAELLMPEPSFCRHPPIKISDGKFLLPIYRSLDTGGAFANDYSQVIELNDKAEKNGNAIDVPESKGRVHGSLVKSADGNHLLQFFRSRRADRIYRSIGNQDGTNWSIPAPIELPNNNSSIQALRLSNGLLAIIFNRFGLPYQPVDLDWGTAQWPMTRWPLSIAISEDDGITWPWIRDIDYGQGFAGQENWHLNGPLAYPTIVEGIPGELHIAYSWGSRTAIKYVCLTVSEVIGQSR
jgi:predicted neuraminidase